MEKYNPAQSIIELTVTPSSGYDFKSITVKDGNGNVIETTKVETNKKYSFIMPESNVTITVNFKLKSSGNTHTIKFFLEDEKTLYKTITVEHGELLEKPEVPGVVTGDYYKYESYVEYWYDSLDPNKEPFDFDSFHLHYHYFLHRQY